MATRGIGGAPVSWVALFGAILGATSIIPAIFWFEGGGYIAMNRLLLPLVGLVLGPYAGAVAGLVGGIIGLLIAPASLTGGIPDLIMLYVVPPLAAGWISKSKTVLPALVLGATGLVARQIFPYYWPGPSAGFQTPTEPYWTYSFWFIILAVIVLITPLGWKYIPAWLRSDDIKRRTLGLVFVYWLASIGASYGWSMAWEGYFFRWPTELAAFIPIAAIPLEHTFASVASGLIASPIIGALRKSGLRKIPNAIW